MDTLNQEEWKDIFQEWEDIVHEYLEENKLMFSKINFKDDIFVQDIYEYILENAKNEGWCDLEDEDDLYEHVFVFCKSYLENIAIPARQNSDRVYSYKNGEIDNSLKYINTFAIQSQRSAEWYAIRQNLFSASNIWKLFSTPGQYNSLIYEKCKGLDVNLVDKTDLLMPNARNWGIRYEPVSVMVYEHKYNTTVNTNYGCIQHETLPIGASPDGIIVDPNSPKYGNMLEIKNIYNREIHGIPSEEYWTQMQIQMECCKLEFCDFLETRFKEYSRDEYIQDNEHEYKGLILFFIPRNSSENSSKFVYMPLNVKNTEQWIEETKIKLQDEYIVYGDFYWFLDEMSCVEVERNSYWFSGTIPIIKKGWETVLYERNHGFDHRATQKRVKKEPNGGNQLEINDTPTTVNLIKLDENGNPIV